MTLTEDWTVLKKYGYMIDLDWECIAELSGNGRKLHVVHTPLSRRYLKKRDKFLKRWKKMCDEAAKNNYLDHDMEPTVNLNSSTVVYDETRQEFHERIVTQNG